MSMFCYQCQESAKNTGCTVAGVCGKKESTSNYQDLLIYVLKGISYIVDESGMELDNSTGNFLSGALFTTVTNTNFDDESVIEHINDALKHRNELREKAAIKELLPDCCTWEPEGKSDLMVKAYTVSPLSTENEDVRSLRELATYGIKGMAAYAHHAAVLGYEDKAIYSFMVKGLASTVRDLTVDEMVNVVMETGKVSVDTMALLDKANTETYGNPEITEVNIGVGTRPGILISGHDLKDMHQLLEQTKDSGIDVYTHGEMLPANYYPAFKKYDHFFGNYGNAWWQQSKEFEAFNGPILMTTNCITPVKDSYKDRIFTTGEVAYPGVTHIVEKEGKKDFSTLIEIAKNSNPPTELETGKIVGGFAHHQVMELADKVVDAVKSGAVKRFVVMGGCDGRQKGRNYFTDLAENLPKDNIILTAGCAKYRYNKLDLGDIGGIPRVLDAGQCNDSYSLAVIALKLKEVFGLADINELPISYDIAWYEQKAVTVLLALLYLGVKGIRLGPTLPAFISPNVVKVLVEKFDIKPTGDVESDLSLISQGK